MIPLLVQLKKICDVYTNVFFLLFTLLLGFQALSAQQNRCVQLNDWLIKGDGLYVHQLEGEFLHQYDWLVQLYDKEKDCRPLWYDSKNGFGKTDALIDVLQETSTPVTYHLFTLLKLYANIKSVQLTVGLFDYEELTEFDVLMSDAALNYAMNLVEEAQAKGSMPESINKDHITNALKKAIEQDEIKSFFTYLVDGQWPGEIPEEIVTEQEEETSSKEETETEIITLPNNPIFNTDAKPSTSVSTTTPKPALPETKSKTNKILDSLKQIIITSAIISHDALENMDVLLQVINDDNQVKFLQSKIYVPALINQLYGLNEAQKIWTTSDRQLNTSLKTLSQIIAQAKAEGLNPMDYHYAILKTFQGLPEADLESLGTTYLNALDIIISDAALRYALHLSRGKIDNPKVHSWNVAPDNKDVVAGLQDALENKEDNNSLKNFYDSLKPQHFVYEQLKAGLKHYEQLEKEGDWLQVPAGKEALKPGVENERVKVLRQRLSGEYSIPEKYFNDVKVDTIRQTPTNNETEKTDSLDLVEKEVKIDSFFNAALYDSVMFKVVQQFQTEHGLDADGIVGSKTIGTLNVSPSEQIDRIKINLERWRWLPELKDDYIMVNIPSYMMYVTEEDDSIVLKKKVMVGKTYHKTPVFDELMLYLDINPYWTVPYSIASKEILPKLKSNPGYLSAKNMKLFSGGKVVNPYNVNWSKISRRNFSYTIRQEPGDDNALGRVKFLFPNLYNVYIHDTPSKSLFATSQRAYSHGCVRLENPFGLAEYLLRDNKKWSPEKIEKTMNKGKNKRIHLDEPLPIYILYFTVWPDENGQPVFLHDIYSRDIKLKDDFLGKKE